MPGMGAGGQGSTYLTHAFHVALQRQGLLLFAVCVAAFVAWHWVRLARAAQGSPIGTAAAPAAAEPAGRRVARLGFGLLWCFDGLLQLQSGMVLGMPSEVLRPAAAGSPGWVVSLTGVAATVWARHPVATACSAVWIQLGIGVLLLLAPRGRWSRFAGVASAGWGLLVWAFGEAFGGVFAPGLSILFGGPGAALLYVAAAALVVLPEQAWAGPRLGRVVVRSLATFLLVMALLQAWPGRGSWAGGSGGALPSMVHQMAQTPQPASLAALLNAFARLLDHHAGAVNLVAVVALVAAGALLLSRRAPRVEAGMAVLGVIGVADWVLVQDLGFLGGTGTDPNSMLPLLLLGATGVVALTHPAEVPVDAPAPAPAAAVRARWGRRSIPTLSGRVVAVGCALAAVLLGAAPMAAASVEPTPTTMLAVAASGAPEITDAAAPALSLVDQHGRPVSLSAFRGDVVVLTFLDPTCTSDCPLIGRELAEADAMLGPRAAHVRFVAVAVNPVLHSRAVLDAYDEEVGLQSVPNWYFLTGPSARLAAVLNSYGVQAVLQEGGGMVDHPDVVYIIDRDGTMRRVLGADPGPTAVYQRSFAALVDSEVGQVARS